jgi:hypothetical protein
MIQSMRFPNVLPSVALTLTIAATLQTQATLRAAPSTRATSEVSLTYAQGQGPADAKPMTIKLDYGQPHLRGRVLHTDSLVPYDKPWRLGANAATRLTTDVDLVLGGTTLPKGTYVLFTLPSRSGWKLIVQKDGPKPEVTYDAANDIASIALRGRTLAEPVESLTMTLIPATGPGAAHGELRISWGTFVQSADWTVK